MAISFTVAAERGVSPLRPFGIIVRVALGLFIHGLVRFGRPATISRATGQVRST